MHSMGTHSIHSLIIHLNIRVASLSMDSGMEKVSSTEYVLTQCSTLFPLAVSLTHIVPKVFSI